MQQAIAAWPKQLRRTMSTATLPTRVQEPARARRRKNQGGGLVAWTFAIPALAVYLAFLVYPALTSLWFSFTNWDGLSATYDVVGVDNYVKMTKDPVVIQAMINNIIWTVVTIVVPVIIGLSLAMLLNGKVRGKTALRMIFYTPCGAAASVDRLDLGLALQPGLRGDQRRSCRDDRAGRPGAAVARTGLDRPLGGHGAGDLAADRLPDAALPSGAAGDQHGHVRGGDRRRGDQVAAVLAHHDAEPAARALHRASRCR